MKKSNVFMIILALVILLLNVKCEKEEKEPEIVEKVDKIEINTESTQVKEYLTIKLGATVFFDNGEIAQGKTVTWKSSSTGNATVDNTGIILGVSEGTSIITASCDGIESEVEITIVSNPISNIEILNLPEELIVSYTVNLEAKIYLESGDILDKPELIQWSLDDNSAATILNNQLFGIKEKTITVTAKIEDLIKEKSIFISAVEENEIPTYLSNPAEGSIEQINVVVIRFLPTLDGENIDVAQATDYWELGEISLTQLKSNIDKYDKRAKFMLEEGSKYREYKNENAISYLGYKIIKYITVYEQIPVSNFAIGNRFQPNYVSVFERFNLNEYVNQNMVEEVWLWYGEPADETFPSYDPNIHENIEKRVGFVESNMSSPTTGDISNSYRYQDDIPILNHTFVVYCYNFRRTQAEMVHNHGHQLESIYKYASEKQDGTYSLFVQKFCGWGDNNYTSPPIGRAGDCHHPPNTTEDYDYLNTTLVESDIEDWKPDNSGEKKQVNVDTWGNLVYDWPGETEFGQRKESQWYIYWMQNMPGYQNTIPYSFGNKMTNWWVFTADWDNSINSNIGLHE